MERVLEFIKTNPGCTKEAITAATDIKGLQLFNILKKALNEQQITTEGEGTEMIYFPAEAVDEEGVEPEEDETQEEVLETDEQKEETSTPKQKTVAKANPAVSSTRTERFSFNGEDGLSKGALARKILSQYVKEHKGITYKQLKEVFPDEFLKRFGLFQDVDTARQISGQKYDRYSFKEDDIIKLKDKQIVVCTQWTSDNIQPLLAKAKELGYKIK